MTNYKEPMVRISGNRLITTSLAISQHFNKKHKDVLRAIELLDCSQHFAQRNFAPCSYQDGNRRPRPMFEITKDGFMFLCMGFTGAAAALWKERYITAFNALEETLHKQHANIGAMQAELLLSRPLWKEIKHYKSLGLNHHEIARLVNRANSTVVKHVRRMENCGLLTPPKDLAKLQQMALRLPNVGVSNA